MWRGKAGSYLLRCKERFSFDRVIGARSKLLQMAPGLVDGGTCIEPALHSCREATDGRPPFSFYSDVSNGVTLMTTKTFVGT